MAQEDLSKVKWWAYLHVSRSIQLKRAFPNNLTTIDIRNAWDSDFVLDVIPPFEALDREDALFQAQQYFDIDL